MPVSDWSETIMVADLLDEPIFSDEIDSLTDQVAAMDALPNVVVNLSTVTFLNSSNIAQLLKLHEYIENRDGLMRLCSVNDRIMAVLTVTGLDRLFDIEDDVASALASIQIGSV